MNNNVVPPNWLSCDGSYFPGQMGVAGGQEERSEEPQKVLEQWTELRLMIKGDGERGVLFHRAQH